MAGHRLLHFAELLEGPVAEHSLAHDKLLRDGAEVAAVAGHITVVAHHKERALRDGEFRNRAPVGVLLGNVVLREGLAVDDMDAVTGDADYALDVALGCVLGIAKDDDVAARNGLETVDEAVDENSLLVFEAGQHAGTFDFDWLIKENDYESGSEKGDHQIAQPHADEIDGGVLAAG